MEVSALEGLAFFDCEQLGAAVLARFCSGVSPVSIIRYLIDPYSYKLSIQKKYTSISQIMSSWLIRFFPTCFRILKIDMFGTLKPHHRLFHPRRELRPSWTTPSASLLVSLYPEDGEFQPFQDLGQDLVATHLSRRNVPNLYSLDSEVEAMVYQTKG